ncbi:MAG: hypothetical protein LBC83_01670 [Oscillospiraceae bacterium]|nr:hypothetical protein [Oscillospiraceae bacterium]
MFWLLANALREGSVHSPKEDFKVKARNHFEKHSWFYSSIIGFLGEAAVALFLR